MIMSKYFIRYKITKLIEANTLLPMSEVLTWSPESNLIHILNDTKVKINDGDAIQFSSDDVHIIINGHSWYFVDTTQIGIGIASSLA